MSFGWSLTYFYSYDEHKIVFVFASLALSLSFCGVSFVSMASDLTRSLRLYLECLKMATVFLWCCRIGSGKINGILWNSATCAWSSALFQSLNFFFVRIWISSDSVKVKWIGFLLSVDFFRRFCFLFSTVLSLSAVVCSI